MNSDKAKEGRRQSEQDLTEANEATEELKDRQASEESAQSPHRSLASFRKRACLLKSPCYSSVCIYTTIMQILVFVAKNSPLWLRRPLRQVHLWLVSSFLPND